MSCHDCSTIEGESELSTDQGTEQSPEIYLNTGADNILLLYILLESCQASVNQQKTMLGTMWGYLRFGALLVHHTTDPTNNQVILLHFSEIYKPAHFLQVVLTLLDFIIVQL